MTAKAHGVAWSKSAPTVGRRSSRASPVDKVGADCRCGRPFPGQTPTRMVKSGPGRASLDHPRKPAYGRGRVCPQRRGTLTMGGVPKCHSVRWPWPFDCLRGVPWLEGSISGVRVPFQAVCMSPRARISSSATFCSTLAPGYCCLPRRCIVRWAGFKSPHFSAGCLPADMLMVKPWRCNLCPKNVSQRIK